MSYVSRQQQATLDASTWQPILSAWLNMPSDSSTPVHLTDIVAADFPLAEAANGLIGSWVWRRV